MKPFDPSTDPMRAEWDVHPRLTRRERRIERQRTQYMGHAQRSAYRVSGSPVMARNGMTRPDATIYMTPEVTR